MIGKELISKIQELGEEKQVAIYYDEFMQHIPHFRVKEENRRNDPDYFDKDLEEEFISISIEH